MIKEVRLRLVHDGHEPGPPLGEPLRFGLQDRIGAVHAGVATDGGALQFELLLTVKGEDGVGPPVFGGVFAHGTPQDRFLYLGWRRLVDAAAPWGWRLKIPLAGIGWAALRDAEGGCVTADVRGRRPHVVGPVAWTIEPLGAAAASSP